MATAEAEAEEDMSLYLVEDYQGRRDVDKKAKELRRDARERRRIFQQQAAVKVQGGLVSQGHTRDMTLCDSLTCSNRLVLLWLDIIGYVCVLRFLSS